MEKHDQKFGTFEPWFMVTMWVSFRAWPISCLHQDHEETIIILFSLTWLELQPVVNLLRAETWYVSANVEPPFILEDHHSHSPFC